MNLGILSLIALLLAIVIGFLRNANVGVLYLAFAMLQGIPNGKLLAGFSSSIFMQMVGITYLFGIVKVNGTLELLAKKLLSLVGKRVHLIPVAVFIIGAILSGIGPGSIPCLAIIPVIVFIYYRGWRVEKISREDDSGGNVPKRDCVSSACCWSVFPEMERVFYGLSLRYGANLSWLRR